MAISQTKYINIISQVGGAEIVPQRELIGRFFMSDILIPTDTVIEFSGGAVAALKSIEEYFGITSPEYSIASDYFSFISKKGTQPSKISFANARSAAMATMLFGKRGVSLSDLRSITNGALTIKFNGSTYDITGINLSTATSLAEVASLILTGSSVDDLLLLTYNSYFDRFILSTKAQDDQIVTDVELSTSGEVSDILGLTNGIYQPGLSEYRSVTEMLTKTTEISNNFLSFCFESPVSSAVATEVAQWVNAQNVRYMFCVNATTMSEAQTLAEYVKDYSGVALSYDPEDKVQILPMSAFAAVDYTRPNAAINMMYQQHPSMTAAVSTDSDSNTLDAIRVNYYGRTQQAGQWIDFYQKGVLMGEISDMGVFVNEAWLKDTISASILNLRLALDTLPATSTGEGLVKAQISNVISVALTNGVIVPGKTLSSTQKAYIGQVSGDSEAWLAVQTAGYWLGTEIVREVDQSGTESYKVHYTLIYAKGDAINFVDGTDILI